MRERLAVPVLAVDGGSGPITSGTTVEVADDVTAVRLDGVGHLVAMEAPEALAAEFLGFCRRLDG